MMGRHKLTLDEAREQLLGATVTSVELDDRDGFVIIRLGALTLYADAPAVYGDDA